MKYLQLDSPPNYLESDFCTFIANDVHINRIANFDVLILMFDGVLRFWEAGKPVELSAGEWYIQKAGLKQEGREISDEPRYFYIHFRGEIGPDNRNSIPVSGRFQPKELMPLIQRLELAKNNLRSKTEQNLLFYEILVLLQEAFKTESRKLQPICNYITAQYAQPINFHSLAGKFGYSTDHLIRLFRSELRMTPHQYLTEVRLRNAQRLLLNTEMTQQEIAISCGYADISTLYRVFMKNTGVSPSEWKRQWVTGVQRTW